MVSILKDIPIDGVKIVPCRVKGPRGIVKSFLVTGNERLILVDTGFSDADADIIMDAIEDMGCKHSDLEACACLPIATAITPAGSRSSRRRSSSR